jgi:hypothetical protein
VSICAGEVDAEDGFVLDDTQIETITMQIPKREQVSVTLLVHCIHHLRICHSRKYQTDITFVIASSNSQSTSPTHSHQQRRGYNEYWKKHNPTQHENLQQQAKAKQNFQVNLRF